MYGTGWHFIEEDIANPLRDWIDEIAVPLVLVWFRVWLSPREEIRSSRAGARIPDQSGAADTLLDE